MNQNTIVFMSVISAVMLITVSYAYTQTSSLSILEASDPVQNPVHHKGPAPSGLGVKVVSSGVVSMTSIEGKKQLVSRAVPPPHPRDLKSYQEYQGLLGSGNLSLGNIPVVPETPVANMTQIRPNTISVDDGSFAGFHLDDNNLSYPPDVQVAAGPNDVMEMVNLEGGIWNKQGVPEAQFPLSYFFSLSGGHVISDPRVIYDIQDGRWFAELMDQTNSTISLAVSQSSDPQGSWYLYKIAYTSPCIDFPKIATSGDKIVISTNDFTGGCESFSQSEMAVLDKDDLINHNAQIGSTDLYDSGQFSVTPARSLSPTDDLYMIANDPTVSGSTITVYKLSGPAASTVMTRNTTSTATVQNDPPLAQQNKTDALLATPPHGFEDVAWFKGQMWSAFTDACRPEQGSANHVYSCVHLFSYNTTTATPLDLEVANSNYNFSYPALTVDARGGVYLVLSQVSSTSYPGIFVTGKTTSDPPNSVEPLSWLVQGSNYDSSCRYGDYFAASLDPSQPLRAWVAGEYNHLDSTFGLEVPCNGATTSPAWSTYVAPVTLWGGVLTRP